MLSRDENDLLTRVGPGTPCGEMLRRYWWPIGFSELVAEKQSPTKVRLLSEDFVLFRNGAGHLGLLELHCSHRGTSLEFGRVEDQGIRCCYHGWLYDTAGRCLEQPAEPADSTFKDRIRHPAYKVRESAGFIFAYLGPDPAPLLPRYDLFLQENGERVIGAGTEYCNWLQRAENSVDQTHLVALHAPEYPQMALKRPEIGWQKTVYGAKVTMHVPGVSKPKHSHWVFPSHTRHTTARKDRVPDHAIRFRVPTDDTTTKTFWLRFTPNDEANRGRPLRLKTVGFEDDKPGVYTRVNDGWWGIASHDQDRVAQESQGEIYDRRNEHLGASDEGVILLRQTIKESIDAVRQGRDPFWILRRPEENDKITFDASMAEIAALG
ncbi:MAG TPA: Rieske 2Fe-2S domain-containing protein [Candidatus Eisenbacteria bacterium]|nr:Rieske 2Fe-2S domain-containing protein [Candidatus Eisenbacteria bacterium]